MGRSVDGVWTNAWYMPDEKGRFVREPTQFDCQVSADGSLGFVAEPGRYHLYVSLACPWAHRTLVMRNLKGLKEAISISIVHPHMGENGWEFADYPGSTPDTVNHASRLHQIYTLAEPRFTGRVTVPVLWDKQAKTIVCNDSRRILRMLDHEFEALSSRKHDYCPPELKSQIDAEIDALYAPVNNGVYRAGFATTQGAYDEAVTQLFEALDGYEQRLATSRYLCGSQLTEADICFFTTLLRFDVAYHGHFKCNVRRIVDYPNLFGYLRDIYQTTHVAETCNLDHIKRHYYTSHPKVNPTGIIPAGPQINLDAPHGRAALG